MVCWQLTARILRPLTTRAIRKSEVVKIMPLLYIAVNTNVHLADAAAWNSEDSLSTDSYAAARAAACGTNSLINHALAPDRAHTAGPRAAHLL